MEAVEQYKQNGVREPIRLRPGKKFHWAFWGGHSFLLFGALLMMMEDGPFENFIGLVGFLFFGTTFLIWLVALLRARERGTVELSGDGLYMSHIGVLLPWSDIGPAWSQPVHIKGMTMHDVCFVVRNAKTHMKKMDFIGRGLFKLALKVSSSRKGGAIQWGLHAALALVDAGTGLHRQTAAILQRMRDAVLEEPGAMVFNVPSLLRFDLSADDLVAILNTEVMARHPERVPAS